MRVVLNNVDNGETEYVGEWELGSHSMNLLLIEERGTPVFLLGMLGPGRHFVCTASTDIRLHIYLGEVQLPNGDLVGAGATVSFKKDEEMRFRCKQPVIYRQIRE